MPHKCVKCGYVFPDGSEELLKGCAQCGCKFFLFVKKEFLKEAEKITQDLSVEEKDQIHKDVMDIIGVEDDDRPIILDLESIRILQPGKYELDIIEIFKGKPLVYRLEDGKYIIDLATSFKTTKK